MITPYLHYSLSSQMYTNFNFMKTAVPTSCPLSYTFLLTYFLRLSPVCDFSGAQEREENSDSENISDFPSFVRLSLSLTIPSQIAFQ